VSPGVPELQISSLIASTAFYRFAASITTHAAAVITIDFCIIAVVESKNEFIDCD
jgi:hypothetical protein